VKQDFEHNFLQGMIGQNPSYLQIPQHPLQQQLQWWLKLTA